MARTAVQPAKVTRPRARGIVARPRLFELIDAHRERPLVWVTGPPGAGKTSLVSSYIDARKLLALWYQVDESDADPATFFYFLGLAAQGLGRRKHKPLPLFTPEYRYGLPAFTRNFLRALVDRSGQHFLLVFDNYQDVAASALIHDIVALATEAIPESANILVCSRALPPAALARLRANSQIALLGWEELQLSREETGELLQARRRGAQVIDADQLWRRAHGWTAGVILLLEQAVSTASSQEAASFDPSLIFDYFAGEILKRTSSETRDFLLRTALLPLMSVPMAQALSGHADAESVLTDLQQKNYFTARHGETHFQYHPLFRDFLLRELSRSVMPDDLADLSARAATLLEADGQLEAAVDLLRRYERWQSLSTMLNTHAPDLLAQGRAQMLAEAIQSLPEALRAEQPWLQFWLGMAFLGSDPGRSVPLFESAFTRFRSDNDAQGTYLSWCSVLEAMRYDWSSSYERWDPWIGILPDLRAQFPDWPSPEIELRVAQVASLSIEWRQPMHADRGYWRQRMLSLTEQYGDVSLKVETYGRVLLSEACYTRTEFAEHSLERLKELSQDRGVSPFALTSALAWCGCYHFRCGRPAECVAACERGLAIARESGSHFNDVPLLSFMGAAAVTLGDVEKCAAAVQAMKLLPVSQTGFGAMFLQSAAVAHALALGEFDRARMHAKIGVEAGRDSGSPFCEVWALNVAATANAVSPAPSEDASRLEQLLASARSIGAKWMEWWTLCIQAYTATRSSSREIATARLQECFRFAIDNNVLGSGVGFALALLAAICEGALKAKVEVEFVKNMIRAHALLPNATLSALEEWPWPVRIRCFGEWQLLIDDKPVTYSHKAPKKSLQLLKCLIAHSAAGDQGVSQDRLIDLLWPEEEADAAHAAFSMALHRLRKLIGADALELTEGRLRLDARRCWVDSWAFELLFEEIRRELREGAHPLERGEQALALYRDHFLSGDTAEPWSTSARERLRSKFVRLTGELAKHWRERGDLDKAMSAWQRGLEIDSLAEAFYQDLMRCYAEQGLKAEALECYHRCKRALSISLGVKPSSATEALYQAALSA